MVSSAIETQSHKSYEYFRTFFKGNGIEIDRRLNLMRKLMELMDRLPSSDHLADSDPIDARRSKIQYLVDTTVSCNQIDLLEDLMSLLELMCEYA